MKNFPEFKCFRDIVFFWKFFLNTDRKAFKNYVTQEGTEVELVGRMDSQLSFEWDEQNGGYNVACFGDYIRCRPNPNQTDPVTGKIIPPDQLPTHRYPSTATPSFYVPAPAIRTEDDVIYRPNLPSFEDNFGQVLNQRDSELLISYLTVPYMRIPLLLTFFGSDDRIHKLQRLRVRNFKSIPLYALSFSLSLRALILLLLSLWFFNNFVARNCVSSSIRFSSSPGSTCGWT